MTAAHPVEPALVGHPKVLPIDSANGHTDFWHTDVTFMAHPPMASMLDAVQLPAAGGDTMWTNVRLADETLAEPLRRLCDELVAFHDSADDAAAVQEGREGMGECPGRSDGPGRASGRSSASRDGPAGAVRQPGFTARSKGFDGRQSADLLRLLYKHATHPSSCADMGARVVGVLDNRATMHYGVHDYGTARRVMHRVTLRRDRPVGPSPARTTPSVPGQG